VAGRPRRPLWKRPDSSFRHGERGRPDVDSEPQRLTLFLSGRLLDLAETLTIRAGQGSVQSFCEAMLTRALEVERSRLKIEDTEARHGRLEGLRAIADDPEYLAEWTAWASHKDDPRPAPPESPPFAVSAELVMSLPPPIPARSAAAETILRHAGLGDDDPLGFLPCLRRGEAPQVDGFEELGEALVDLEGELKGAEAIDRRLAHALHRLAIESQVLHTDAWPGAFDAWTVDAVRAVQEAVDRILSGEAGSYGVVDPPGPEGVP